ncbi:hypothetical protein Tco_0987210 [Tanacetum coccineum]
MEYFDLWDSCMIKSLKPPKFGNHLWFLIQQVPSGRTSNALSIPRSLRHLLQHLPFYDGNESHNRNLRAILTNGIASCLTLSDQGYVEGLELYKASVLALGRLTLGLFPSYTSCFSGIVLRVLGPLVTLLALNQFGILLGESEEGQVASSGWPFVFAVLGLVAHLVTSLTLDSARSCVIQSASFTQGKVSNIPTVFSWGSSISPDGFLHSILLVMVIIVAVVVVVVVVVFVVVVAVIVVVVFIGEGSSIIKLLFMIIGCRSLSTGSQ